MNEMQLILLGLVVLGSACILLSYRYRTPKDRKYGNEYYNITWHWVANTDS
jgi:hypothetical protein